MTPAGMMTRYKRFQVVGFFEAGSEIDGYLLFMHWQDAAKLARQPNQVESIRFKVGDIFAAPELTKLIAAQWRDHRFSYEDWTETHGTLFRAVEMEKIMVTLLLLLIVIVASFNMISSFVMMVTEKAADIAILRTMGATPKQIRNIFIIQGAIISAIGISIGVLVGLLVAANITGWVSGLQLFFGVDLFATYFVTYLPSIIEWRDLVLVIGVSLILGMAATLLPAWKALSVEPVEALRYE